MTFTADLGGHVALVTGASGSLGSHFAAVLARSGAAVAVAGRRRERLEEVAEEIRRAGGTALPVILDVTDEASVSAAFDVIEAGPGHVDILLNNSGVAGSGRRLLDTAADEFEQVVDVDLTGCFRVARACAARLRAAGKPGSIVNIASILATGTSQGVAAYMAAKGGLVQLTKAMALEWARHDIRVNALAPGYVLTDLNKAFFETEAGHRTKARIPQRRLGELADLDGPLLLLASDASRHMTGSVVVVDGGHLCASL
jgi:NAD(P)-dependent dehydrogenase (short-subunit alcohol dehydrogenase family)